MIKFIKKVPLIINFYIIAIIIHFSSLFFLTNTIEKKEIKMVNVYVTVLDKDEKTADIKTSLSGVYDIKDGYMYIRKFNIMDIINLLMLMLIIISPFFTNNDNDDVVEWLLSRKNKKTYEDYIYLKDIIKGHDSDIDYGIYVSMNADGSRYRYNPTKYSNKSDENISFSATKDETLIINLELIDGEEIIEV